MKNDKRVLFIAPQPYFQWRGSPIRVGFDVMAIARQGFEVDLLVLPFGEEKVIEGVSIERVPNLFGVSDVSIGPSFLKACFDVLLFMKACRLLMKRSYGIIHCVEDAGLIGLFLSGIAGVKFVFEKHSDPASYKKGLLRNIVMSIYGAVERCCIRGADAVICTGEGLARQAESSGGRGKVYNIGDIPSSLAVADDGRVVEIRNGWVQGPDDVVAAYAGSFAVYQGVDLLFETFAEAAKASRNLKLAVIGGTESEITQRKEWLEARGCAEKVIFQGKVAPDELASFLKAADILISPRLSGVNTPLKLLDYLKAGRAILASDTAANRLILDDNTACFADPEPGAMSKKLVALSEDSEMRNKLARSGGRLIEDKYNYENFSRLIGIVYKELDGANAN